MTMGLVDFDRPRRSEDCLTAPKRPDVSSQERVSEAPANSDSAGNSEMITGTMERTLHEGPHPIPTQEEIDRPCPPIPDDVARNMRAIIGELF